MTTSFLLRLGTLLLACLFPLSSHADPLTVEEAIRVAWQHNMGLAGGQAMVEAARGDAEVARAGWLPSMVVSANALATKEPMMAFGLKLNQQRIGAADFDPARLNSPDLVGGFGLGATVMQPLYMGGRLAAGRQAAVAQAEAESLTQTRRTQELALNVVRAYFGAQVAMQGLAFAQDVLTQARETENFARARNQQGLALDADVARATAFRAQAEADHSIAEQRLASARAMLVLLTDERAATAELATPLSLPDWGPAGANPDGEERPDVRAARLRIEGARQMAAATHGKLLPEVLAQATVETMRSDFDQGALWYSLGLVARWRLSIADRRAEVADKHRIAASVAAHEWQARQARYEIEEARRSLDSARERMVSAQEAINAAESARTLRRERHREGLLPLTEVLDAEAGLAGARALLLRSEFEARFANAQVQFASGQPIEGVK